MAINWNDQLEVERFKADAIQAGFKPEQVDVFVQQSNEAPLPQPSPRPVITQTGDLELPSKTAEVVGMDSPMPEPIKPPEMKQEESKPYDPTGKTIEQIMAETGKQDELDQMRKSGITPSLPVQPEANQVVEQPLPESTILPSKVRVTQPFGNKSKIEKYSGGVNLGADFATPADTELKVPPGEWVVVTASPGFNQGSGNFVRVKNTQTGETLGFEHLNKIGVAPGQKLSAGATVGLSGGAQSGAGRGNSTGAHSSIVYQTAEGKYQDVLRSPYAQYLWK